MKIIACVVVMLLGCDDPTTSEEKSIATVAMVSRSDVSFQVIYGEEHKRDQFTQILAGAEPRDFHWALLSIPTELIGDLQTGTRIDLSSVSGVSFAQVYRDVCNPARDDVSSCWLYERYISMQDGLSGSIAVQQDENGVRGAIDLTWQGLTERFGPPVQWHKHGTLASFSISNESGSAR